MYFCISSFSGIRVYYLDLKYPTYIVHTTTILSTLKYEQRCNTRYLIFKVRELLRMHSFQFKKKIKLLNPLLMLFCNLSKESRYVVVCIINLET